MSGEKHRRGAATTGPAGAGAVPEAIGPERSAALSRAALALIAAGAALSALALAAGGLDRFGFAYLWGFSFAWAIVLGSLFFVALHHVTHAVWSVVIRRVAEMLAAPMWVMAFLFVPVLLFAVFYDRFSLFPWTDPAVVEGDHVLEGKTPYLNIVFFAVRAAVFFGCWILFTRFFVGQSLAQDASAGAPDDLEARRVLRMRKVSAPFMLVFALTVTFASFDWFMSQDPHWFSTIFGVYVFSGMTVSALAAITLAVVWLRARGRLGDGVVTGEHLYSLGGLIFAFTCFWAYIAFSQFMLIWYGNLPEETVYFAHRVENGWLKISLLLVALRFVLPFFLLLSRDAKMDARRLVVVSVIVLAGQLTDLYWLIMPQLFEAEPRVGWQEAGPLLLFTGVLIFFAARFLSRHRTMAVGDPLFGESQAFHL